MQKWIENYQASLVDTAGKRAKNLVCTDAARAGK
jgi:hypothetical protein